MVKKSIADLIYHSEVLDSIGLDKTAKIQLHVGGVYNDKKSAIERFYTTYKSLNESIKKRIICLYI